ncbi:hypothetical protein nbrc107696_36300 [Gordonia spumicola]|uniref:Uncharacterized protein n=1 Tax=Gordonia spumicola TaxID=589161 RepID=A0A7I9VD09_9ACTN|nr:hypothetical protein nbrc107696_36300 [Gordonia spumicola]
MRECCFGVDAEKVGCHHKVSCDAIRGRPVEGLQVATDLRVQIGCGHIVGQDGLITRWLAHNVQSIARYTQNAVKPPTTRVGGFTNVEFGGVLLSHTD